MATRAEGAARCATARESLAAAGYPVPAVEAIARYEWVGRVLDGVARRPADHQPTTSDRIDAVLTHKLWGTLIFVAAMAVLFSSIFVFAVPLMDLIDAAVGSLAAFVESILPEGALQSLVVDGVIGGVGAVVIFLPQILILFFFIALLEDCGYMARAAFLMDRLMAGVGLSGKVVHSAAVVVRLRRAGHHGDARHRKSPRPPGHDSHRAADELLGPAAGVRDSHRCVRAGPALPGRPSRPAGTGAAWRCTPWASIAAIGMAWLLKKTLLRGETPPFVMELPSYKMPSARTVLYRMGERGWAFLARAGTVIFAVTIVIWALTYYPRERRASRARISPHSERSLQATPTHWPSSTIRRIWPTSRPACTSDTAFWAAPASGSNRSSGRSAGIGGSAARRSPRSRPRSGDGRAGRDLPDGPRCRRGRRRRPEPLAATSCAPPAGTTRASRCTICRWRCRSWCSSRCAPSVPRRSP